MELFEDYDRAAAVAYAHFWARRRNPRYYDFEELGGDCTNFASQCLYAGSGIMNFTPELGWYYIDPQNRAPAWTGVEFLYDFLTRARDSVGPVGEECGMDAVRPGDLIQLSFQGVRYQHTPVIVAVGEPPRPENILITAHSMDADDRPLSTYSFRSIRFIRIKGVRRP